MTDQVHGLDEPCTVCGRVSGDHTLREWAVCLGQTTIDLPYEAIPDDAARIAREQLGVKLGLPEDWLVADNVIAKAMFIESDSGPVSVRSPIVVHEFSVATPSGLVSVSPPIAYLSSPDTIRKYGRLIRDTANGAANAATGAKR